MYVSTKNSVLIGRKRNGLGVWVALFSFYINIILVMWSLYPLALDIFLGSPISVSLTPQNTREVIQMVIANILMKVIIYINYFN